jgi:hypothetical protein
LTHLTKLTGINAGVYIHSALEQYTTSVKMAIEYNEPNTLNENIVFKK